MALTISLPTIYESFPGHTMFRTSDVDEAAAQVGQIYSPHRLRLLDDAADFTCEVDSVQLGPLTLSYLAYSSPVVISSEDPTSYYAVSWPLGGHADVRQAEDETATGPDLAGVVNPEGPVQFRWGEDLELLSARIDRAALMAHLGRMLGGPVDHPLRFDQPMGLDGPGHAWVELVELVEDLVESPDDAATYPLVSSQLEDAVLTALLLLQPNTYSRQLWGAPRHAPPRAVRRTMDLVAATPEEPHTAATMAEEAGISTRSLAEAFGELTGVTPTDFLRDVRLSRAHDDLLAADPDAVTVPATALRWGFADLPHFAALYGQRYGTGPIEALRTG